MTAADVRRLPGTEDREPVVQPSVPPEIDVAMKKGGPPPGSTKRDCRHRHVTLEVDRRVLCNDCEQHIDPVDYLKALVGDWEHYRQRYRDAGLEVRALEKRVAALQRQEKNAKARVRRVEPAELKEARIALKEVGEALSAFYWHDAGALGISRDDSRLLRLRQAGARAARAAVALSPDARAATEPLA